MKVFHIETKAKISKIEFDASGLPEKIGLVTTIQLLILLKKPSHSSGKGNDEGDSQNSLKAMEKRKKHKDERLDWF